MTLSWRGEGRGGEGREVCGFEERRAAGLIVWCCGKIHVIANGGFRLDDRMG